MQMDSIITQSTQANQAGRTPLQHYANFAYLLLAGGIIGKFGAIRPHCSRPERCTRLLTRQQLCTQLVPSIISATTCRIVERVRSRSYRRRCCCCICGLVLLEYRAQHLSEHSSIHVADVGGRKAQGGICGTLQVPLPALLRLDLVVVPRGAVHGVVSGNLVWVCTHHIE